MFLIVPLTILVARIAETSMETVRTVYVARGYVNLAAGVGVVKVGIWLLSTGLVLTNLTDYWSIFAYIAGYGIGTLAGMEIEKMISLGDVVVRLISPGDPQPFMTRLSGLGYGMTRLEGAGTFSNSVSVILMIVPRSQLSRLVSVISAEYPSVLYTVEDVRSVKSGAVIFHRDTKSRILGFFGL